MLALSEKNGSDPNLLAVLFDNNKILNKNKY